VLCAICKRTRINAIDEYNIHEEERGDRKIPQESNSRSRITRNVYELEMKHVLESPETQGIVVGSPEVKHVVESPKHVVGSPEVKHIIDESPELKCMVTRSEPLEDESPEVRRMVTRSETYGHPK